MFFLIENSKLINNNKFHKIIFKFFLYFVKLKSNFLDFKIKNKSNEKNLKMDFQTFQNLKTKIKL